MKIIIDYDKKKMSLVLYKSAELTEFLSNLITILEYNEIFYFFSKWETQVKKYDELKNF